MADIIKLDAAFLSETGRKSNGVNEDSAGVHIPDTDHLLVNKGVALVVADGVSSAEAGREASQAAVERFLSEYFQTPDTWSVSHSGEKILSTINLRLYRKSHDYAAEGKGYLSTFSAMVIKGRTGHFFHIGDSRIYLLRKSEEGDASLTCLTTDHTAMISDHKSFLIRAIGMDNHLPLDYGRHPLESGDRLLLCSDGIHDFIEHDRILELLSADSSAEDISRSLLDAALVGKSDDNISAVVAIIAHLPDESLDDYSVKLTRLPFPPELEAGMKLDGYLVEKELFASSRSQLYLVRDIESGRLLAMKTPSRNFEDDVSYIDRFIQEEWIGLRIRSPHVVEVIRQNRPRTALYYVMEYLEGMGLDDWIETHQPPSAKDAIAILKQIAKGLKVFHDNEAIHQDLKPANVLICRADNGDENGGKKGGKSCEERAVLVDFGSVYVAGLAELQRPLDHAGALGTAGYSDPSYLLGKNPGIAGDVYALATLTYEIFTGQLPYGDDVEECRTALDYDRLRYRSASQFNAVIPLWFDRALEKGVSFNLEERYGNIEALMTDLTQPNADFLRDDPVGDGDDNPLMFWKLLSGFWFVTLLLVMYLFSQLS